LAWRHREKQILNVAAVIHPQSSMSPLPNFPPPPKTTSWWAAGRSFLSPSHFFGGFWTDCCFVCRS